MKPTIGRIVHYVQERPAGYGGSLVHLPAIIVAVFHNNLVNLQVFTDGTNSDPFNTFQVKRITSVSIDSSENPLPHTWHWPERE